MEFRVLGSLEVLDADGRSITPTSGRLRGLLAILLLRANESVTADRLIDGLWGDDPPPTAPKVVQNLVSQLRKTLPDRLETRGHSYVLRVEPGELDLERFQTLVEQARQCRRSRDLETAAAKLDEAVSLWRGTALADLGQGRFAFPEADWLEELRLTAIEEHAAVELELGAGAELVGELEQLVHEQPLRERLRGQLMLALYRAGRQADALDAYRRGRVTLVEQLGIEPGEDLRRLEQAILQHDPDLEPEPHPTPEALTTAEPARRFRLRRPVVVVGAVLLLAAAATAAGLGLGRGGSPVVVTPDSVAVISPGSGRVLAVIPVGSNPDAIAIRGGAAWVANADDGTLSRIDLKTRKVVATIGIGGPVADVATDGRSIWVVTGSEGKLVEVDPRTNAVVSHLDLSGRNTLLPAAAYAVAAGEGSVWIGSSAAGGTLFRLDSTSRRAAPVLTGAWTPAGIAASGGSVWVARSVGGTVRLSTSNNAVTASVDEPPLAVSLAVGDGSVWVGDPGSFSGPSAIWQLTPATATIVRAIQVAGTPLGIAVGNGAVWVAGGESGVLSELDSRRGAVIRSVTLGGSLLDVAYAAGAVWVTVGAGSRS